MDWVDTILGAVAVLVAISLAMMPIMFFIGTAHATWRTGHTGGSVVLGLIPLGLFLLLVPAYFVVDPYWYYIFAPSALGWWILCGIIAFAIYKMVQRSSLLAARLDDSPLDPREIEDDDELRGGFPEGIAAVLFALVGAILLVLTPFLQPIAINKALNARRLAQTSPEVGGEGAAYFAMAIAALALTVWFAGFVYLITNWVPAVSG